MENQLHKLQSKYSSEIKQYGISEVTVTEGRIKVKSESNIPYELFCSIECYLL